MRCTVCGGSHHRLFQANQLSIATQVCPRNDAFDGATYDSYQDYARLKTGLERVRWIMTHPAGFWWSLAELSSKADVPLNSVSSRVRDLRKAKNGSLHVESRRVRGGLWQYRVISAEEMALRELAGTG